MRLPSALVLGLEEERLVDLRSHDHGSGRGEPKIELFGPSPEEHGRRDRHAALDRQLVWSGREVGARRCTHRYAFPDIYLPSNIHAACGPPLSRTNRVDASGDGVGVRVRQMWLDAQWVVPYVA